MLNVLFKKEFERGEVLMCTIKNTVYSSRMITRPNDEQIGEFYVSGIEVSYSKRKIDGDVEYIEFIKKSDITLFYDIKSEQTVDFFEKHFVKTINNKKAVSRTAKLIKLGMTAD